MSNNPKNTLAYEQYVLDNVANCIKSPTNSAVRNVIAVKSVDENGKPTEYEAVDIATLSDKYEWHEIQLYRSVAYIANDPDYAASITDWDGLVQIPDPEYPDDEKAISTIISIIGNIFNQGPTYMNSYAVTSCNSIATSYLAIYNAGIFTTSVYLAIKNRYDNSVTKYSLAYRADNNVLTIMQYPAYRDMNQVIYDIGAKQIISESIDHNFYYTKKYVDETKIPIPEVVSVGQTIVVKSVDKNGKPAEWETVDPWVITSSTEGSAKKFKITIDDGGVLVATEIVESTT